MPKPNQNQTENLNDGELAEQARLYNASSMPPLDEEGQKRLRAAEEALEREVARSYIMTGTRSQPHAPAATEPFLKSGEDKAQREAAAGPQDT